MTTNARFERELPTILEDLYLGSAPDYRDEALATAFGNSQRAAWTFAGRWIPMLDVAVRPVAAPRLPLRAISVALVVIALLLAALVAFGSGHHGLRPFGPAENGLLTWATNGDVYVGDTTDGTKRVVVQTDDDDRYPVFSRDGTKLAFLRQVPAHTGRFDLVVMPAEGGAPQVLTPVSIGIPDAVEWAPDGTSLLVNSREQPFTLTRYFVDGSAPAVLLTGVHLLADAFRPPDGAQILYQREDGGGALFVMNADGSGAHPVLESSTAPCRPCRVAAPGRWSPDGRLIAVPIDIDGIQVRIHVINADGSGFRQLAYEQGVWTEFDPAWSPDGTRIAFNRWSRDESGEWTAQRVGVVASSGGEVGPIAAPAYDGGLIQWSPDGSTILYLPPAVTDAASYGNQGDLGRPILVDMAHDSSRQIDWTIGSNASWQRR